MTVHYTGWMTDGKAFDSSVARGKPATFPLNRVIAADTEGLQLMTGEKSGASDSPRLGVQRASRPPAGMLVFDVEPRVQRRWRSTCSCRALIHPDWDIWHPITV